tara:strand:+ start:3097 stop:4269 length:1173 start_codon:yes stop_codon:yes gene_type:complete
MFDYKKQFLFNFVPKLRFGYKITNLCSEELKNILGNKILFVSDKGLNKQKVFSDLILDLKEINVEILIFDSVVADPTLKNVHECLGIAKSFNPTGILGFGGGSPMDVAKVVSLLHGSNQNLEQIWGVNKAIGKRMPLCLIPTTAGTGSEVTPISIITTDDDEKKGIVTSHILPDITIIDPYFTLSLPTNITAYSGIDAIVHAIEAFTSKNINNNYLSKVFSIEALKLLSSSIKGAVFESKNKEFRGNMLLGSTLAGFAFANSPVAGVHALAYPIGGSFKIPHGLSNALILPEVIKFNYFNGNISNDYDYLSEIIFSHYDFDIRKKNNYIFDDLKTLCMELNLPVRLRDVGVNMEDCEKLAKEAMKQTRLLVNNPVEIRYEDALSIYKKSW